MELPHRTVDVAIAGRVRLRGRSRRSWRAAVRAEDEEEAVATRRRLVQLLVGACTRRVCSNNTQVTVVSSARRSLEPGDTRPDSILGNDLSLPRQRPGARRSEAVQCVPARAVISVKCDIKTPLPSSIVRRKASSGLCSSGACTLRRTRSAVSVQRSARLRPTCLAWLPASPPNKQQTTLKG